jgi:regulator of replication initiation timing
MSEVHIRINKRALERTVYWLIIIALAITLFVQQPTEPAVDSEQLTILEQEVANLTAQNQDLQTQVTSLQETNADLIDEKEVLEQEQASAPEPEPESTEPELSGELDISYDAVVSDNKLQRVVVAISNGLESNEMLTIRTNWNGGDLSNVVKTREVLVRSGNSETVLIEDLISNVPDGIDDIKIVIEDADGNILVEDWIEVFN